MESQCSLKEVEFQNIEIQVEQVNQILEEIEEVRERIGEHRKRVQVCRDEFSARMLSLYMRSYMALVDELESVGQFEHVKEADGRVTCVDSVGQLGFGYRASLSSPDLFMSQ